MFHARAFRLRSQGVSINEIMSASFSYAIEVVAQRGAGDDRAVVVPLHAGVVIALADGAGGTGNGGLAAQAVIDAVTEGMWKSRAWPTLLSEIDRDAARLRGGQTTAVVVHVTEDEIVGASVGDSGAWVIRGSQIEDLTEGQIRKPLLGSGCHPLAVRAAALGSGTLLVASDGLLRYAKPADIARVAAGADLAVAAREMVALVRLGSGALQDDVSVVLCREARQSVARTKAR